MSYSPGTLLFLTPDRWYERLLAAGTQGPFCHVEVVADDRTSYAALGHAGVVRHPIPRPAAVRTPVFPAELLPRGFAWLERQCGLPYSYLAIATDALRMLLPVRSPFLVAPSAYDCSKLAAMFLIQAGVTLPDDLFAAPALASPNSLYRALAAPGV